LVQEAALRTLSDEHPIAVVLTHRESTSSKLELVIADR